MATTEATPLDKDQACDSVTLAKKLSNGEHLTEDEKHHLFDCESCLRDVVKLLDESRTDDIGDNLAGRGRPEAIRAIEHGRRVFEREFGIVLPPSE